MVPLHHHQTHLVGEGGQTDVLIENMEDFHLHLEYFIFSVSVVCGLYEVHDAWTVYLFLFGSYKEAAYCK